MSGRVTLELRGAEAHITIDRPEARNAMSQEMFEELIAHCDRLDAMDEVRVVVLRGAGNNFVAGGDIGQFRSFASGEDGLAYEKRTERGIGRLERLGKPTVAVIDGYAVGGGMILASVCDLRLCSEEARFGLPIARTLGNVPSIRNLARISALLGVARTKQLVMTARLLSAAEALELGLATEVVPAERLEGRVDELCRTISSHAPLTMRAAKEALRRLSFEDLPDASDLTREVYGSRDFHEGVAAFFEKRRPVWQGR